MKTKAVKSKTFCDKCTKEIHVGYGSGSTVITLSAEHPWHDRANVKTKWDLCIFCWSSVYESMKSLIVPTNL